jgi:hypothetical protein
MHFLQNASYIVLDRAGGNRWGEYVVREVRLE